MKFKVQTPGSKTTLLAALLAALGTANCGAQLSHYYNFTTGSANDQVGTANGVLEGTASLTGGALVTTGTLGTLSGGVPSNGLMLPSTAVAGITGAFTLECWYQVVYNGGYCTSFSFSDGTTANYVLATPARGNFPYASSISVVGGGGSYTGPGDTEASGIYQDNGALHEMVVTYDGNTLSYYQDGSLANYPQQTGSTIEPTIVDPGLNLSSLTDIGIAGGSPWGDNSVNGQTFSFAIFDQSLSASQVASLYSLGDSASTTQVVSVVPEPGTLTLSALGGMGLLLWRRRSTMSQRA